jgi:hypothetical protein
VCVSPEGERNVHEYRGVEWGLGVHA